MAACWLKVSLRVRPADIETAGAELWSLGTIGLEQRSADGRYLVEAYFELPSPLPAVATEPGTEFWNGLGARLDRVETIAEEDWLAEYRRRAAVFHLGRGFLIDPREPGLAPETPDGRVLLKLPARQAFGTGSHESTRLVAEWLEDQDLGKTRILDVGTGTGILAFVALSLGAPRVVAVEIDPASGLMARINQRLNHAVFPLVVGTVDSLASSEIFDLALVNVLPHRIAGDLERLAALVRPGGRAVFSGILAESSGRFLQSLQRVGFVPSERIQADEWMALVVEKEVQ
jgi:ribosomal protein L11 methyltransferase